ncbi:MAG: N-acetyltransferase [Bacteroidia bacterium]
MEVKITQTETKGHAFIGDENKPLAEMTFSIAGPTRIIIDHTEVDESLKGKGAGKQMLMALVEKARNENFKILPLCPFAHSVFRKDPSIKDVWS